MKHTEYHDANSQKYVLLQLWVMLINACVVHELEIAPN